MQMDGPLGIISALLLRGLAVGLLLGYGHRMVGNPVRRLAWLVAVGSVVGLTMAERFWPTMHDDVFVLWAALCIALGGLVPTFIAAAVLDRKTVLVRDAVGWMVDERSLATRATRATLGYLVAAMPAGFLLYYGLRPLLVR